MVDFEYDIVGIGFGPSNLALAVALEERGTSISELYLEGGDSFSWHSGMLIESTRMQVSFMKDLVTLRNPCSRYTFVNYLHTISRLERFVNLRDFFVFRSEFAAYLKWVALQFGSKVKYATRVCSVEPVQERGRLHGFVLEAEDGTGRRQAYTARSISLAKGGRPQVPAVLRDLLGERVFHSSSYMMRRPDMMRDGRDKNFVVIGAGQSAAEIVSDLMERCPDSQITAIFRKFAFEPADSSKFVNEIFDYSRVAWFHSLPAQTKALIKARHWNTNYSAIDAPLIDRIYAQLYERSLLGNDRVQFRNLTEVVAAERIGDRIRLTLESSVAEPLRAIVEADRVVVATGFDWDLDWSIMGAIRPYVVDCDGDIVFEPHHALELKGAEKGVACYVQGYGVAAYGLSDTLFSVLAHRSGKIAERVCAEARTARRRRTRVPAVRNGVEQRDEVVADAEAAPLPGAIVHGWMPPLDSK